MTTLAVSATPKTTPETTLAEVLDAATDAIARGVKPRAIERTLQSHSLSREDAAAIVAQARTDAKAYKRTPAFLRTRRNRHLRHLLFGSLWFAGGTALTAITYAAAENGGTYIVAWGAIALGGFEALVGLVGSLVYTARLAAARTATPTTAYRA